MTFNEILEFCQMINRNLINFGQNIVDFMFQEFSLGAVGSVPLINILFGTGLIVFLTIKIIKSLIF